MNSILIKNASQVLTLAGPARARTGPEMSNLGILHDASILISEGRIAQVGFLEELALPDAHTLETIDAQGCSVMPAFIDAHTHPVFAGDRMDEFEMRIRGRTYREISEAGGGILSSVRRTRQATDDELLHQARKFSRWFLCGGTTTIEAKSGYGLSVKEEIRALRLIHRLNHEGPLEWVPTLLAAHVLPEEFRDRRNDYVRTIIEKLLPGVAREGLAEYADVFCEEGAFNLAETRMLLLAARSVGLKIRIHTNQFSNSGGAELAAELSARTADHLDHLDEAGIVTLRDARVVPVLLPASIYHLGRTEFPPARKMIDGGLAVVLATDFNPGTAPTTSMPMVLSLACTQMRMTPAEAVSASTINAAYALDRGDRLGSIEAGKQADLIILSCPDYRQMIYHFGIPFVRTVLKRGRPYAAIP
ncbi:MAG: imidazolonepropionase [Acidobacteria bacterium]|nr:imidazolonepropionase [Acidobacteriota bacterium]